MSNAYAYDGHGRLIQKLSGKHTKQSFQWDDDHRLMAIATTRRPNTPEATTQTVKFDYDALGRRVAKHDSFGTTRFIWEGMRLIEERRSDKAGKQSGNVVTCVYEPGSYVPLARIDADGQSTDAGGVGTTRDGIPAPVSADQALKQPPHEDHSAAANDDRDALQHNESRAHQQARGSGPAHLANVYYFHTDQVGLPEELSDQHGQIRWRAAYKTWGNTVAERWEAVNLAGEALNERAEDPNAHNQPLEVQQNLRFQGQYLDRESGLHYNTFRFYDPDIGRFISPDPIGLNGGLNLTSYAPNPNVWIDPWGLCSKALGKDLEANGSPNPGNSAAHHLAGDTSVRAAPSRAILNKHGIDVDSAENGVWLPNRNNVDASQPGILHNGRHPNSYVDAVNTRLQNADAAATKAGTNGATAAQQRAMIVSELDAIRSEMLAASRSDPWSTVIPP